METTNRKGGDWELKKVKGYAVMQGGKGAYKYVPAPWPKVG